MDDPEDHNNDSGVGGVDEGVKLSSPPPVPPSPPPQPQTSSNNNPYGYGNYQAAPSTSSASHSHAGPTSYGTNPTTPNIRIEAHSGEDPEDGADGGGGGEKRPLLSSSNPHARPNTTPSPRRQMAFNVFMVIGLLATIGLIITLVVLSNTNQAGNVNNNDDVEPENKTMLMLGAAGDVEYVDEAEEPFPDYNNDVGNSSSSAINNGSANGTDQGILVNNGTGTTTSTTTIAPAPPAPTTTMAPPIVVEEPPLDPNVQVTIDQGTLQGLKLNSSLTNNGNGSEYLAFLGIPYAQPPIGDLRFMPPVEPDVWNGTRNATKFSSSCLQIDPASLVIFGDEDCLYLNVYTPKNSSELGGNRRRGGGGGRGGGGRGRGRSAAQLPVIVYLSSGDETSRRVSPEAFMSQNVILVTLDSRLGIFGSLNLNSSNATGNQGLKDQAMALQWVQDNIRQFGGNRRKVTLFGNAGLGSVHASAHLLSPMSDGLFKRVILNTATILTPGTFVPVTNQTIQDGLRFGEQLNCTGAASTNTSNENNVTMTVEELINCLTNLTAAQLLEATVNNTFAAAWNNKISLDLASADPDSTFLSDTPLNLLQAGNLAKMPMLIGTSTTNASTGSNPLPKDSNSTTEEILTQILDLPSTSNNTGVIVQDVQGYYFPNNTSGNGTQEEQQLNLAANWTELIQDRYYRHPVTVLAETQFQVNNGTGGGGGFASIFALFGRNNNNGIYLYHLNTTGTTGAGSEIDDLFFPNDNNDFSVMLIGLWSSFANTGIPTYNRTTAVDGNNNSTGTNNTVSWIPINNQTEGKPYQALDLNYYNFIHYNKASTNGNNTNSSSDYYYLPSMIEYFGPSMTFWDSFNLTDLY